VAPWKVVEYFFNAHLSFWFAWCIYLNFLIADVWRNASDCDSSSVGEKPAVFADHHAVFSLPICETIPLGMNCMHAISIAGVVKAQVKSSQRSALPSMLHFIPWLL